MLIRKSLIALLAAGALLNACGGDPPASRYASGPEVAAYHPDNDPLINPDWLFEDLTDENRDQADLDATLLRHLIGLKEPAPRSVVRLVTFFPSSSDWVGSGLSSCRILFRSSARKHFSFH